MPNASSGLLDHLCLDYNKMQKHMNKESEVHRWTCLNENLHTFLIDFTPGGKEENEIS